MSQQSTMFDNTFRLIGLQYAIGALQHLKTMGYFMGIGDRVMANLSRFRSVHQDNLGEFFQLHSALFKAARQVVDLAESCASSGKYVPDLNTALQRCSDILQQMDRDDDLMEVIIPGMLTRK